MKTERLIISPPGIEGILELPARMQGVVVFAHGSGSSRFSPRNRAVASGLHTAGFGTLLFDLLTEAEAEDRRNVFDIDLLAERLLIATRALRAQHIGHGTAIGYFGASTGAAAALAAAAASQAAVAAVVSRGGRPDLAAAVLPEVAAPTLLIVGSLDHEVLELNRQALALLHCEKKLAVVDGATHLFEEPGTMEEVIALAGAWFKAHMITDAGPAGG
jgi:putative phosphoribosyl transferase